MMKKKFITTWNKILYLAGIPLASSSTVKIWSAKPNKIKKRIKLFTSNELLVSNTKLLDELSILFSSSKRITSPFLIT